MPGTSLPGVSQPVFRAWRAANRGARPGCNTPGPAATPVPVQDPAAVQVVRAELHEHPVVQQDLDVVLPDLPADVREHLVPVLELHPEGGVAKALDDGALDFDGFLLSSSYATHQLQVLLTRCAPMPSNSADRRAVGLVDLGRRRLDPAAVQRTQHLGQHRPGDAAAAADRPGPRPARSARAAAPAPPGPAPHTGRRPRPPRTSTGPPGAPSGRGGTPTGIDCQPTVASTSSRIASVHLAQRALLAPAPTAQDRHVRRRLARCRAR